MEKDVIKNEDGLYIRLSKEELIHLENDTINYIYKIKKRVFGDDWNFGTDITEVEELTEQQKLWLEEMGYFSRKALYDKLREIERKYFPELTQMG